MWVIWRSRDGYGEVCTHQITDAEGELCTEVMMFNTEAEAARLAGIWNSVDPRWSYQPRRAF